MTRTHCSLILLIVLTLTATAASGQVTTGTPPFGSFGGSPDIINLANLNAHTTIPVLHKAGRGLQFTYDLSYDASVWYPILVNGTNTWQPVTNWGWTGQTQAVTGSISYLWTQFPACGGMGSEVTFYDWVYSDAFGAAHSFSGGLNYFAGLGCNGSPVQMTVAASDGSGYVLTAYAPSVVNSYITGPTGQVIYPPVNNGTGAATSTDSNGNQISVDGSGNFTDTLGTKALAVSGAGSPSSPMYLTYTAPSGANATYTVRYLAYTVQTLFGCSGVHEYGPTPNMFLTSEVDLPDGSKYSFIYETTPGDTHSPHYITGRPASITLPSGGTISYVYTNGNITGSAASNGIVCVNGSTAGLQRTTPDTGSAYWNYARSLGTGAATTTTITDPERDSLAPSGNDAVLQFQGIYETERQTYQGLHTTGTLLETIYTCYDGTTTNCNSTAVALPITQRTTFVQWPGTSSLESESNAFYNSNGFVTEKDEYGYGLGAPGSLIRKTLTTYASLGAIVGKPATVTVEDGSSSIKSQTTYGYDQTSLTTTTAPQHVSVSGSRGNVTTSTYLVQGSATLSRTYSYYDTGNVLAAVDINGAQTTYTYGACGNTFPTAINEPLSLAMSMTWNCTGAVKTGVTDENGKATAKAYTDLYFWRPSSVTDKAAAVTNYTYAAATPTTPAIAESALLFNSGNSVVDVLSTLDTLGRGHLQQTKQTPSATTFDSVETDYNSSGDPSRVTLPYVGTVSQTSSSTPATLMTYDALGRALTTTDGGLGSSSFTYSQNDASTIVGPPPTGEHTKQKQFEYDALGRLISVCEITNSLAGNGTCLQTTSATGYWTKYVYDVNNNLTSVTQNAQSTSSAQTRTYVYDDMGRMISETNPEAGLTTIYYFYDSDPGTQGSTTCPGTYKGDLIKRVDAVGNVTCYSYDALHRITSATYSGPYASNTPGKYYVYDSATVNGVSMTNAKTRQAEAFTATCLTCTKITDVGLSYSARSETSDIYEKTPNSGGYYHVNETYWANGVPFQLGQLVGLPTITYGLDGEGRPNTTSASSGQNPITGVAYNVFSLPTQVSFGSSDSDTFSYDASTARTNQYQFNINGQSVTGTLTWNSNSTLHGLAITDPFNSANSQTCLYSYDDLGRIGSANCGSAASQSFTYDPFGNINKSGSPYSFQPTYSTSTNRMTLLGSSTPTYDSNGNVTNDFLHTYSWDAEGAPTTVDTVNVIYDALGHAVEQNRSGAYTQIVYAPSGEKLALMNGQTLQKAFVPLPGGATAVYANAGLSCYRHPDWLGSARLDSTPTRTVSSETAYAPFGEVYLQSGVTDPSFTGKNQDTVPNLYDFPARLYGIQGRWPSPDPAGLSSVDPTSPQTWNRYAYVSNDPLDATDPSGTCTIFIGGVNDNAGDKNALSEAAKKVGGIYVTPYDGEGTVGGILSVAAQALAGPNASTADVTAALNSIQDDPNGIQIVAFSGGAQAFSTAVESGSVGNLASGGPLSSVNLVVYLSPGLGPGGELAFQNSSFTHVYHGTGLKDFAATFFARLSGQAGKALPGASGHHSLNVNHLPPSITSQYTKCVIQNNPMLLPLFSGDFPWFDWLLDGCFINEGNYWWACPPPE